MPVNMADENAEAELDWSGRQSLLLDEDTFFAMEGLQATFQQLEAELRQQDVSEESSTEYCNNFCQVRVAENAACMRIVICNVSELWWLALADQDASCGWNQPCVDVISTCGPFSEQCKRKTTVS